MIDETKENLISSGQCSLQCHVTNDIIEVEVTQPTVYQSTVCEIHNNLAE